MSAESLSQRETEVLALLSRGARNKEIATQLVITENTVETHLKTIFKKLCVRSRLEAVLSAPRQHGHPED
jgi:DNA-binding NarL/FixJ family response regulator